MPFEKGPQRFPTNYCRFPRKKSFNSRPQFSSSTPNRISVFGCSTGCSMRWYPALSSEAPKMSFPSCAHFIAEAHIRQGSRVTNREQSFRYLAPKKFAALVSAIISAWAVTSPSCSVMLYPRAIMRSPDTTTAPTGTSSASKAFFCFLKCLVHKIFVREDRICHSTSIILYIFAE